MNIDKKLSQKIPNYEFAGQWQINAKGSALVTMVAGGILVFVLSFILGIAIRDVLRGVYEGKIVFELFFLPIFLVTIVAILILHEAIHGVLFLITGGKPYFGFKLIGRFFPVAYATSTVPMLRNQYLLVCLGPFLILTLVLTLMSALVNDRIAMLMLMAMALNVSGSVLDLAAAFKILRHDRRTLFEDMREGFAWYVPQNKN